MVCFFLITIVILLIGAIKFELDHTVAKEPSHIERRRRDRAQQILTQGGPQSLQEYLSVFPEACSQCGGRVLYESNTFPPSFLSKLLNRKPYRTWVCTRCGANNLGSNPIKPLCRLRHITSPYLSSGQSNTISEPSYETSSIYPVYCHNDDVTTMEFVVAVLKEVFDLPEKVAVQIMIMVHQAGKSFVIALPYQEAQQRITQAHEMAQAQKYPLRFTLEKTWICN